MFSCNEYNLYEYILLNWSQMAYRFAIYVRELWDRIERHKG